MQAKTLSEIPEFHSDLMRLIAHEDFITLSPVKVSSLEIFFF
jgi:hypothetical protein